MTASPAISVADLSVVAGGKQILAIDRLTVAPGEVLTVLGPNGAGKSTLIKSLCGFVKPVAGEVTVLGRRVRRLGSAGIVRLRRRVGYVPQLLDDRPDMPLTVREVVAIGRTGIAGLLRRLGRADRRLVDEWLERLGLADFAGQRFGDCSGGQKRRALLAKAMVQQPELLLLDEPAANLDLAGREALVETIDRVYADTGVTIVLVCHELEVIPPCCRRVVLLRDGQCVDDGRPASVLTAEVAGDLYGPSVTVMHGRGRSALVPVDAQPEGLE